MYVFHLTINIIISIKEINKKIIKLNNFLTLNEKGRWVSKNFNFFLEFNSKY